MRNTKVNFRKVMAVALLAGAAFGASADIFAQRGSGPRGPGRDNGRDHGRTRPLPGPARGAEYEVESSFIGKTLSFEKLFLGRELGLRMEEGKEIEEVTLFIDGMGRGGTMQLTINGQDVSRIQDFRGGRVGEQIIQFKLHRPFIIGQNVQRIQVEVNGTAYIESASVLLKNPRHGRPGRGQLTGHPFERVFGTEILDLAQMVDAGPRQAGRNVKLVELEIENFDRQAQLRLCKKEQFSFSFDIGISVGGQGRFDRPRRRPAPGRDHSFNCQNTTLARGFGHQVIQLHANGEDLEDLEIMARGEMTIKKVTVHFERF